MKRLLWICIVLLTFTGVLEAEEVMRLSLEEAVRVAIKKNLGLKVRKYEPAKAEQKILKNRGAFDPSVSISLSRSYERAQSPTIVASSEQRSLETTLSLEGKLFTGTQYSLQWNYQKFRGNSTFLTLNPYHLTELTLSVSQPLLKGYGKEIQKSMIYVSEKDRAISEERLREDTEELIIKVVKAYLGLLLAEEGCKAAELSLRLGENILKEVKAKIEAGLLPAVEIYEAEAEVAKREAALLEAKNRLKDARDHLRVLLNIPWHQEIEVLPEQYKKKDLLLDELIDRAFKRRGDIKEAELQLQRAEVLERYYKNQVLPDLEVFASYGLSGLSSSRSDVFDRLSQGGDKNWTVGITLQMPFFNRTSKAEYHRARYERLQAEVRLRELKKGVVFEIRKKLRALRLAEEEIESRRKIRIAYQKRYEAEEGRFREGLSTLNDVLRYQEEYVEALLQEKKAVFDCIAAFVELKKAEGALFEEFGINLGQAYAQK
jgi:outer membrane protein TolC